MPESLGETEKQIRDSEKLVYLDQVRPALAELRGLVLPNSAIERAIRDTLDNLGDAYSNIEIIHKDGAELAVEVTKNISGRSSVFLDSQVFRDEISKHAGTAYPVSRARFSPINLTPGMGPIVSHGRPMQERREQVARKHAGKEVVLLDDLLVTGWTLTRIIPYFSEAGIKICAIGVAISSQPEDTFVIGDKKLPVYAGYKLNSPTKIATFELKNFLVTPGSGAAHFRGAIKDGQQIARINESLRAHFNTGKDASALRRELFALQLDFNDGELLHKVSQIVGEGPTTEELVNILRSVQLPNFQPDVVDPTRSLYIGDYHSSAWRMTEEVWKEFSRRQIETSIRLYEDIRQVNAGSVTVGQLGIFDEFALDKTVSVEKYLAEKVKRMETQ